MGLVCFKPFGDCAHKVFGVRGGFGFTQAFVCGGVLQMGEAICDVLVVGDGTRSKAFV